MTSGTRLQKVVSLIIYDRARHPSLDTLLARLYNVQVLQSPHADIMHMIGMCKLRAGGKQATPPVEAAHIIVPTVPTSSVADGAASASDSDAATGAPVQEADLC